MMDTVKRLMAGKSGAVERGIDKAVEYLGRSNDSLKRQAEAAKARARALDPDHPEGPTTASAPPPGGSAPGGTRSIPPVADAAPAPPASPPSVPPPAPSGGPSLRGDLVDPPEVPPVG